MSLRVPVLSFLTKEPIIQAHGKKLFKLLAKSDQKKSTPLRLKESGF